MPTSTDADWRRRPGRLFFLTQFVRPEMIDDLADLPMLREVLGEDPVKVAEELLSSGLLEIADPIDSIAQRLERFDVRELRMHLGVDELPILRRKSKLIAQFMQQDSESLRPFVLRRTLLRCTKEGKLAVDEYIKQSADALDEFGSGRRKRISLVLKVIAGGIVGWTSGIGQNLIASRIDALIRNPESRQMQSKPLQSEVQCLTQAPPYFVAINARIQALDQPGTGCEPIFLRPPSCEDYLMDGEGLQTELAAKVGRLLIPPPANETHVVYEVFCGKSLKVISECQFRFRYLDSHGDCVLDTDNQSWVLGCPGGMWCPFSSAQ